METGVLTHGFCQDCSWTWKLNHEGVWENCPACGSEDVTFHTEEEIENA